MDDYSLSSVCSWFAITVFGSSDKSGI